MNKSRNQPKDNVCQMADLCDKRFFLSDQDKKDSIIEQIRGINLEVKAIAEKCKLTPKEKWEERCKRDPGFAALADEFWFKDVGLHTLPLHKTDSLFFADVVMSVLVRARLTACRRYEILTRIPDSWEEHEQIIDAVAKKPSAGAEKKIRCALHNHIVNSQKHFSTS